CPTSVRCIQIINGYSSKIQPPAHKAKSTQQWLVDNCPDFIRSEERPASSPDLNPLDYSIWETLETIVNANPITVWNR
ncbi:unnamed protein product, partial [Rotaria magnacalcarata]